MNRRAFLHRSLLGSAALATFPWDAPAAAPGETPSPCPPAAWRKNGIVLAASEPWEHGSIQNFTCPAEPLENGRWRLWYSSSGNPYTIAFAEGVPGERFTRHPARCSPREPEDTAFSIGNLPEKWNPVQVVHFRLRNGRHRIYFWAHGPRIVRYLAAESGDGRRFRVLDPLKPVLYHPSDRAAWGVRSPDGVVAHAEPSNDLPPGEPRAESKLISNDATNLCLLPDGTFEMYSVGLVQVPKTDPAYVAHDNAPGWLRVIDRYASGDGLHFENRRRIIARDASDPADQQFYYLAVTPTPQGRVGMLGHYRVQAQTMDLEWCVSADGLRWQRPLRQAWLPRGEKGAPDCYGVYAPNGLVRHDGKWHLFYTGVNTAHNHKDACGSPASSAVLYATADSIWA